jgi:hypothetical protein
VSFRDGKRVLDRVREIHNLVNSSPIITRPNADKAMAADNVQSILGTALKKVDPNITNIPITIIERPCLSLFFMRTLLLHRTFDAN